MSILTWERSPIFGDEYIVSSYGDVYSLRTGAMLKPSKDKSGYLYYVLCVNGNRRTVKAHRMVALSFIENIENKPTVNHKNGIRTDNRVDNLEWATWKEQKNDPLTKAKMEAVFSRTDYRAMGARRNFGRIPVTITWRNGLKENFQSLRDASRRTGKGYGKMSEVINGKRPQYKEFCIAVTKKHFPEGEEDGNRS